MPTTAIARPGGPRAALARISAAASRDPRRTALAIYLLAAVVTVCFGLAVRYRAAPALLEADELEYFAIATELLAGAHEVGGRRTLAFPLLLAAVRSLTGDFLLLQVAASLIYAASPVLLFALVRRLGGRDGSALGAALVLTVWPPALFYGASLYSESVALPAFLLALLCLPVGSRLVAGSARVDIRSCLVAGLTLALATHVRTMYQLFLPFLLLVLLFEERRIRVALARFGLVVAAFLLGILPWSLHVSAGLGRPVLVTANGGETLAGGLTPRLLDGPDLGDEALADAAVQGRRAWNGPGKWVEPELTGYLSPAELALPYAEKDRLLRTRAVGWALANPDRAAALEAAKLGYMWGFHGFDRNGVRQVVFGNLPTIALLAVAILLAFRRRRAAAPLARLWILPVFVSAVALISWGSWRFRQPGDAGLIAFVAIAAGRRPNLAER